MASKLAAAAEARLPDADLKLLADGIHHRLPEDGTRSAPADLPGLNVDPPGYSRSPVGDGVLSA